MSANHFHRKDGLQSPSYTSMHAWSHTISCMLAHTIVNMHACLYTHACTCYNACMHLKLHASVEAFPWSYCKVQLSSESGQNILVSYEIKYM